MLSRAGSLPSGVRWKFYTQQKMEIIDVGGGRSYTGRIVEGRTGTYAHTYVRTQARPSSPGEQEGEAMWTGLIERVHHLLPLRYAGAPVEPYEGPVERRYLIFTAAVAAVAARHPLGMAITRSKRKKSRYVKTDTVDLPLALCGAR